MKARIRKIINLHDGDEGTAGAQQQNEGQGAATSAEASRSSGKGSTIRPDIVRRGRELGLSDDMLEDYQNAVDSRNRPQQPIQQEHKQESEKQGSDDEWNELIKGKYKSQYGESMRKAVLERVGAKDREITQLKSQNESAQRILHILENKYPGVKSGDLDGLLKAVEADDDIWRERALEDGTSAKELRSQFEQEQQRQAQQQELEQLRQEKAMRELDDRLQRQAAQTKQLYPDFNIQEEFQNPQFRAALDFIAQQREEQNKRLGRNDEVFDLTFAYEMAHAQEIRDNTIKRVSHATQRAVAQDIASGARRPQENAGRHSAPARPRSVDDMSDEEFDAFLEKVKNGEARIGRF